MTQRLRIIVGLVAVTIIGFVAGALGMSVVLAAWLLFAISLGVAGVLIYQYFAYPQGAHAAGLQEAYLEGWDDRDQQVVA